MFVAVLVDFECVVILMPRPFSPSFAPVLAANQSTSRCVGKSYRLLHFGYVSDRSSLRQTAFRNSNGS